MEQTIKYLEWYQNSELNHTFDDMLKEVEYKGEQAGEKIGFKKGEKVGCQKTAQNLLALKVPISVICKATGLSKNDIKKIKENLNKEGY